MILDERLSATTVFNLNDTLRVGTAVVRRDLVVVSASPELANLLHCALFAADDRLPEALMKLTTIGGTAVGLSHHPLMLAFATGHVTSGELFKLVRADNSAIPVRLDVLPIGPIDGMPCAVINVTDLSLLMAIEEVQENDAILFRSAFDLSAVGMALVGNEERLQEANRALSAFTGYGEAELMMHDIHDLIHPLDRDLHREAIQGLLQRKNATFQGEMRYRRKDGSTRHGAISLALICDDVTATQSIVYVVQDVTAQHVAETHLRDSEERLRTLVANAPIALFALDAQGVYVVNQGLVAGDQAAEAVGRSFFVVNKAHPELLYHARRALAGTAVAFISRADHTVLDHRLEPILDSEGNVAGVIGIITDISERQHAEEAQKRSEARFRKLVEMSPVGIHISDHTGTVETANRALCQLYGVTPAQIIGAQAELLVPLENRASYRQQFESVLNGHGEVRNEMDVSLDALHSITVLAISLSITSGDGQPRVATFTVDLTDRKLSELLLETARETALTAEREQALFLARSNEELSLSNQELEQFAYVASHDLQEPLRTITSYMGLLRRRLTDVEHEPEIDDFVSFAIDGAQRMSLLIKALLAYSRTGSKALDATTLQLSDLLADATRTLQAQITERGAIITHDELPECVGDRILLTQLMQNLIGNAMKFCKGQPRINVAATEEESQWHVTIADNGIGIDSQFAERIFLIFQRLHTREEYDGTGIGLSICKRVVERHGGEIWMESKLGEGTTCHFTLPK